MNYSQMEVFKKQDFVNGEDLVISLINNPQYDDVNIRIILDKIEINLTNKECDLLIYALTVKSAYETLKNQIGILCNVEL
jgi:hypothetical protein